MKRTSVRDISCAFAPPWFLHVGGIWHAISNLGQLHIGDPRLKSEHALDRELLSLGITEGKRYTAVVDADLTPDTPYRWAGW